jgi:hypothetical protein
MLIMFVLLFSLACENHSGNNNNRPDKQDNKIPIKAKKASELVDRKNEKLLQRDFSQPEKSTINYFQEDIGTLSPGNSITKIITVQDQNQIFTTTIKPISGLGSTEKSQPTFLLITFDNDIFAETDYYYTNGFSIGMVHPKLASGFFSRILPSLGNTAFNTSGIRVHQFMFTPQNPEAIEIDRNDRPFAGVLLTEYFKLSQLPNMGINMHTSLRLGVIGKASMAESLQATMHKLEPVGWDYQIKNDLLINYDFSLEKLLLKGDFWQISGMLDLGLGSYQTYGGGALQFRVGILQGLPNGYLPELDPVNETYRPAGSFWFFIEPAWHFMAYNASLNGGLFNNNSPHYFSYNEINHSLARFSAGFSWHYRKLGLGLKWTYLSPEFQSAKHHNWGSLSLLYTL